MSYQGVETMSKSSVILFPKTAAMLKQLGENMRLARLRRNVTARLTAERAGISVTTLTKIEQGNPAVSMGSYLQVLVTLNLERDILKVAADDELGRALQDLGLRVRARASKRKSISGLRISRYFCVILLAIWRRIWRSRAGSREKSVRVLMRRLHSSRDDAPHNVR